MRFFTKSTVLAIALFLGILIFSNKSIAQCSLPTNFTFTPDSSHSGTVITFTSVVSGGSGTPTYLWDFGDSTTSTLQHPTHTYNYSGCSIKSYTVSLVVNVGSSCGSYQANVIVNNNITPSLQDIDPYTPFSNCDNNPSNSNPNFLITLYNTTADSSMVTHYILNWGDGGSASTITNSSFPITHTYTQLGLFNLSITAFDSNGCQATKTYDIANQGNPAIGLSSLGNTQGCAPQTFKFVLNQYQYNSPGTYYVWDFSDGSPNITWNYNDPFVNDTISHTFTTSSCSQSSNTYSVQVTAYNNCDFTTATVGNIRIYSSPTAEFTLSADTGCVNSPICVTNTTISGFGYNCNAFASYVWNFGDPASGINNTSTSLNACHTYNSPGSYTISLTASNGICGVSVLSKQVLINDMPHAIATPSTINGCIPLNVNFNNGSYGGNLTHNWSVSPVSGWSFNSPFAADSINSSIEFNLLGNYNVILTSTNNCGNDDTTITITTFDKPIVNIAAIPNSCNTFSLTPNPTYIDNGSAITSYDWSFPGGVPSSSSQQNPTNIDYTTPGTYTVTVIITNSCGTDTATQTFTIFPLPNVVVSSNSPSICFGDSVILTATGAVNYSWSPVNNLNNNTGVIVKAGPTSSTLYFVTGTDNNGCLNSDSVNITIHPLPILTNTPSSSTICAGDSVSLTVSGASTYSWSPATALNTTSGASVIANPTTTTTYTVVGVDLNGCSNSATVVVNVNQLPNVSISSNTSVICIGDSVILNAIGAINYSWSPTATLNSGSGTSVVANPLSTTTYNVIGTDNNGCINTDNISITVNPLPNVGVSSNSPSICFGDSVILTASGAVNYSWSPVNNMSSNSGTIVKASPPSSTLYFVTGTDNNGCSNFDSINVNINQLPILTITPSSSTICAGDSVSLTVGGANTYSWSPATALNTTTGASVIANPTTTTTYTVVGVDLNGCTNTTSIIINVNQLPNVSISSTTNVICIGDSVILNASGATTYSWSPTTTLNSGSGTSVIANPLSTTNYNVIGTDNNGCINTDNISITVNPLPNVTAYSNSYSICYGETATLTANGASSYVWSPASSLNSSTASTVLASPITSTIYQLIGTDNNGCANTDTVSINVKALPVLTTNPASPSLCTGDTVLVTVSGATSYLWSPGAGLSSTTGAAVSVFPLVSSNYSIIGTANNGCIDTLNMTVNVNPTLTILVNPSAPSVCLGDSITLTASGANNFSWSPSTGLSATTGSTIKASPTVNTTYNVIGSNSSGCFNTTSFTIQVNPKPIITANSNSNLICAGQSVTMTASGANNYVWSPSAGLSTNTGSTIIAAPTSTTSYIVQGLLPTGCFSTDTVTIGVNPLPTISINPGSASICYGDSININASGALTYNWSPSAGINNSIGSSIIAFPTSTTQYNVIASDNNGCVDSSSITITVNPLPNVSVNPNSPEICFGDSVLITANGASSYSWSPAIGLSSALGASVQAFPYTTSTYTVTGTDQNGCVYDEMVVVDVIPLPIISINASSDTICLGQSVSMTASGANSYVWSPSTALSTTTGNTTIATPTSTTSYIVKGISSTGCESTDTITIVVNPLPTIAINPGSASICWGDSINLSASGATSYNWSPTIGINNSTASSIIAFPTTTTQYIVSGSDNNGCFNSSTITINVNPIPTVSVNPNSPMICFGDSVQLSANGALTYNWSPAIGLNTNSGSIVQAFPNTTSTYTVTGTDQNGCSGEDVIVVDVNPLPTISINASSDTICLGQSTTLTASGASTYAWTPATGLSSTSGSSITASPITTTTYYVQGVNANACENDDSITIVVNQVLTLSVNPSSPTICNGDSVALTVSGANTYSWSQSVSLNSASGASVMAFPNNTTTYSVTGTNVNGCINTTNVVVSVNPLPIISTNLTSSTICNGDSVAVNASGATNYSWTPALGLNTTTANAIIANPSTTTNYTVTGTDGNGCSNNATVMINVNQLPNLNITASSSSICFGDTTTISVTGANVYTWTPSGFGISSNGNMFHASPQNTTKYFVNGTDINGCVNNDSISIIVNQLPTITVNPANTSICLGDSVSITASGATQYMWSPSSGLNNSNSANIVASPITNSTYTVIGTDNNSCVNTTIAIINVNSLPQISFTHDSVACINSNVVFNNNSMGANSFSWDFGNGNFSTSNNPTSTYSSTGFQTIKLIGQSPNGCLDSAFSVIQTISAPIANYSMLPDSGCAPLNVQFINSSSGFGMTHNWNFGNGINSNLQNPPNITFNQLASGNNTYLVSLLSTNMCGSSSFTDTVFVKPQPVVNFGLSSNYGCSPLAISYSNVTTGLATSYLWDMGNGISSSAAQPPVQVYTAGSADSIYSITLIANNYCGSDTMTKQITVRPQSVTALFNPSVYFGCAPLTVTFNNFSTLNSNISWDFDDGNFSTTYSPTNTYLTAGTYHVKLYVSDTCSADTAYVTINVNSFPVLDFTANPDTICVYEDVHFTNLSSNLSNVVWKFGDGNTSTVSNPTYNYTASGLFDVTLIGTAQGSSCVDSITKTVFVKNTPIASFTPSSSDGCYPLNVTLINTSMNSTYFSWDFGDGNSSVLNQPNHTYTSAGTFNITLIAQFPNGCTDTAFSSVIAHPKPISSFSLSSSQSCGYPANVQATNTSTTSSGYTWDFGNGNSSGLNNPTINYNSPGSYDISLISSNVFGCTDTATTQYTVYEKPVADFTIENNEGCEPLSVAITDKSQFATNYTWYMGDGNIYNTISPSHIYNSDGLFSITLIASGNGGCTDTLSFKDTINVHPKPKVDFTFENTNIPLPNSGIIQFTNLTVQGTTFDWDFGDGSFSTEVSPKYRYSMHGLYTVNLTANNQFNCSAEKSKEIEVDYIKGLFIPNAFSPNNPAEEVRLFKPSGMGLKEYYIGIYDSWGNLIWESTELANGMPTEGWNGEFKGKEMPQDVYVWKASGIFMDNSLWQGMDNGNGEFQKYGSITLIR
ncbi:MAG: PKD domain-containing protein [Saprospiraceae bacterium]|nr:PKD domain-containing protein [Saprospiraceae bacterium]